MTKCPLALSVGMGTPGMEKVTIGNYKGVMLCNRPFTGVGAILNKKQKYHDNTSPIESEAFVCGTVKKPWGIGNFVGKTSEEKTKVMSRLSKKDGALSKHKKWLKQMQEERERLEKDRAKEAHIKDERKRDFMEKQARKRSVAMQETSGLCDNKWKGPEEEIDNVELYPSGTSLKENIPPGRPRNHSIVRPAWALTESVAKDIDNSAKVLEEENLLSFANDLDFDKYAHDLELNILMNQVKERIQALQKEKNVDEARLQSVMDSEVAVMRAEKIGSISVEDSEIIEDNRYALQEIDDDIRSVAESVRSEGSVSCIHSQRSMEALVTKSRKRIAGEGRGLSAIQESPAEISMEPPKLITHIEDNGARLSETKSLNKLPFKNRNPAL